MDTWRRKSAASKAVCRLAGASAAAAPGAATAAAARRASASRAASRSSSSGMRSACRLAPASSESLPREGTKQKGAERDASALCPAPLKERAQAGAGALLRRSEAQPRGARGAQAARGQAVPRAQGQASVAWRLPTQGGSR